MRQIPLEWRTHGGPRKKAGRKPPVGRRASERHKKRPKLDANKPLHVVIRAARGLQLRTGKVYGAIRAAMEHTALRIVHISIQATHVHLIVEATSRLDLARAMQGFQISAAKRINAALGRTGTVFADRYHATPLSTPRQVRNTIAYVLNNWRKHDEHKRAIAKLWRKDPFASATTFDGWRDEDRGAARQAPPTYEPLPVRRPRTWLLGTGWRRRGLIALAEVPRE